MEAENFPVLYEQERRYWWFQGRLAIVREVLARWAPRRRYRALNLGCGTGAVTEALAGEADVVSLDLSPAALSFCRKVGLARLVSADAQRVPLASAAFDVVLALDILEHLPDDARGAREIARVLAPGGVLVASCPAFEALWSGFDDLAMHQRRYTRPRLVRELRKAGLDVELSSYFNTWLLPAAIAHRVRDRVAARRVDPDTALPQVPPLMNGLLARLFASEGRWIRGTGLPAGLSVLAVARKR